MKPAQAGSGQEGPAEQEVTENGYFEKCRLTRIQITIKET